MAPSAYVQELNKPTSTSNPMSSIALVYFSPTGNSKKAVSSIGELPCVTVKTFDITGNVEVPETYDELKEVIHTLSENEVTPIAVGGKDRWPFLGWFSYLAQRTGGVDLYQEVCYGDKNFTEIELTKMPQESLVTLLRLTVSGSREWLQWRPNILMGRSS